MFRKHRFGKPDPLILLALAVGLAVLVTTTARAASPTGAWQDSAAMHRSGANAPQGTAEVANSGGILSRLARAIPAELRRDGALTLLHPAKGVGLQMSLQQPSAIQASLTASGDSGIGAVRERSEVYLTLHADW